MWHSLCFWIFIVLVPSLADVIDADHSNVCGQFSPEACATSIGSCSTNKESDTTICCDVTQSVPIKESLAIHPNIKYMYIYNATLEELNMTTGAGLHMESLTIIGGRIQKINGIYNFTKIKCLNLSGNALARIDDMNLTLLEHLQILDLSRNNLTNLPEVKMHNFSIDVSGNAGMKCTHIHELMVKMENYTLTFRNKNDTFCSMTNGFMWFNSTDTVTLQHIEEINEVDKQCKKFLGMYKCNCSPERWNLLPGQTISLTLNVNCSNRQLNALPSQLPANTAALDVSYNNIGDLKALNEEESYKSLIDFRADNNHISSITILEYTGFINNFSWLSLRNNHLKMIPTYFLSNAFDRNMASRSLYLGGNKLTCDCDTIQDLKVWLMSNKKFIHDYDEVQCSNYPKNVVELSQHEVCITQRIWTDYIYYIIAGEVILLIFLISKVSYDYWIFKTAGYLPWPASKLPKLPCDWVFET